MAQNPWTPDEDPNTLFLERTFLAGDYLTGVGYGVQLVLFTFCAIYLLETRKSQAKSKFLLGYITLLLAVETVYQIDQAYTVQVVYVDNRNYPGGPWEYFMATQNLPINIVYLASYFSITFLSDLLVFWRCWVIWTAFSRQIAFLVMVFPALLLLASLVMGTLWVLQSSQPGLSFYSALPLAYGTSYYAISFGANIILTFLIIGRLLAYRRTVLNTMTKDHTREYASLATIIIESASLYSIFAIGFLITYGINNPMNQIFFSLSNSGQQIANYLIILRVSQGRGWRTDTTTNTIGALSTRMSFEPHRSINQTRSRVSDVANLSIHEKGLLPPHHPHSFPSSTTIVHDHYA